MSTSIITERHKIATVECVYYIEIALSATPLSSRAQKTRTRSDLLPEDDYDSDDITFSYILRMRHRHDGRRTCDFSTDQ